MPILIVDDEKEVRDSLRDVLNSAGYEVVTASNGVEAMERIRGNKVRMMLVDLSMPEMGGDELISSLYDDNTLPPSLVITAMAPWTMLDLFEYGVGYLRKPVCGKMLIDTIESLLRKEACHGNAVAC